MCRTNPVKRNLTIRLDEDLLKAARRIARAKNTSVNQLVREHLEELVRRTDPQKTALAEIEEIFRTRRSQIGPITWTRDDLYER